MATEWEMDPNFGLDVFSFHNQMSFSTKDVDQYGSYININGENAGQSKFYYNEMWVRVG